MNSSFSIVVQPEWDAAQAEFIQGDIRDSVAVNTAIAGCDALLHLAAAHHDFGIEERTFFAVNEGGAKVLCASMDQNKVAKCCFFSTVAIYGHAPEPIIEDTPPQPFNPYGKSKLAGEAVFRQWSNNGLNRQCLVIRPTVTFGPRNFANMYTLIRAIHTGKFLQFGSGKNIKSLSYVENIVDFALHMWSKDDLPAFHPCNFIDKPDLTSRETTEVIYRALGKKPPPFKPPLWLGVLAGLPFDLVIALTGKNLPISTARIKKLATQTKYEANRMQSSGFTPRYSLNEGIEKMVRWYLEEGKNQKAIWHLPPAQITTQPA